MSSPYSGSSCGSDGDWLSNFLEQGGFAQLLLEVPMAYFQESLFLYDLESEVRHFPEAVALITENVFAEGAQAEEISKSASILYARAHCRYALTPQGLEDLRTRYETCYFGKCPRYLCGGQRLLPYGASEKPGRSVLRCLCPCCGELYKLFDYDGEFYVDGCFYGPNVAYAFQLAYSCCDGGEMQLYVPMVYGFRLHADGERSRAACAEARDAEEAGGVGGAKGAGKLVVAGGSRVLSPDATEDVSGSLKRARLVRIALSRSAGDPVALRALAMLGGTARAAGAEATF